MSRNLALCVLVAAGACSPKPADPSPPGVATASEFNTAIPMNEFMAHVLDPAAYAFWGGSGTIYTEQGDFEIKPQDEGEWKVVEDGAATVVLAVNSLMLPEYQKEPTGDWNLYAKKVADIALSAKQAVEAKDLILMQSLGAELDQACEACHLQFAPSIERQFKPVQ